jgi:hypothetical protein
MEWISLKENPPTNKGLVLGCDWYSGDYRVLVCETPGHDAYWCGKKTGYKTLDVLNSCCPSIGDGGSSYWMPIPKKKDKRWIKFVKGKYKEGEYDEVLVHLFNGNYYVVVINAGCFEPTFNMFKWGDLESIDVYMKLPEPPPYVAPKPLTAEQEEQKKNWLKQWDTEYE